MHGILTQVTGKEFPSPGGTIPRLLQKLFAGIHTREKSQKQVNIFWTIKESLMKISKTLICMPKLIHLFKPI
jgi:hypothetical protein